jgi:hypothetical protein
MVVDTPIYIEDKISDVVDLLRLTGNITDIVDNTDDTYTVTVDNLESDYDEVFELNENDWITITGTPGFNYEWKVTNITASGFDISREGMEAGITIPGTYGEYKSNKPYFDYEKWPKEANKLTELNKLAYKRYQKFPLIFLLEDITQDESVSGYYCSANLNIFFVTYTQQNKDAKWRLENKIKLILQPIYDNFIKALIESRIITAISSKQLNKSKTNRYFLGTEGENQNALNTIVDAIELNLKNVEFLYNKNTCIT